MFCFPLVQILAYKLLKNNSGVGYQKPVDKDGKLSTEVEN